ncbi:coiled-coil domain-containing protein 178 [Brachyhypopomus gauderio]|uniref:coiled-coil domain-containing protein 178 n=1 Tax=Brachyhypopomus gauderio TaxID=698409 RepID=UPI0040426B0B
MPDIKLLQRPSREGGDRLHDQGELQRVYVSRSCEVSNTPGPCVSNARRHIQELKNKLEIWCHQGTDNPEDRSVRTNHNRVIWRFDSTNYTIPVTSTELCIEGTGLCLLRNDESKTLDLFWKGMSGTGGVLLEALALVERLETGRREAGEALREEHQKAQRLRRKQDSLSLWKLQHFPTAVQLEYEVCTRDIAELKWHLKLREEQRRRARAVLGRAEAQNRRLVDDVDFLQKHGPLVKDKLQLETEVMKQIRRETAQASDSFTKLSHDLRRSQQELENEEVKTNEEREAMTVELRDVHNQLKDQLTNLQQLTSYWDFYCLQVRETEEKTAMKDTQLHDVVQQIQLLETQETQMNNAVVELRTKVYDQEKELREKHDEITRLLKQTQATRDEEEATLSECEEVRRRKQQELQRLRSENEDHEMEMEDWERKISQSKKAVKQLQMERKKTLEKISQMEVQAEQAEGELSGHASRHANTRASLEDLEQKTLVQEQRKMKEIERLKMQLKNEMKAVLVLKGDIASITEEFNLAKADGETVENELVRDYEDTSTAVAQLETEMVVLRETHTAKSKIIETLKWRLSDVLNKHTSLSDVLEQKKMVCLHHLDSAKDARSAVSARCEQVSSRILELSQKSEEHRKVSETLEHVVATVSRAIEELQSAFDVVERKHGVANLVASALQRDAAACRTRTARAQETHAALLSQRDATMQDLKANLQKALKENAQLAQEYSELQRALMTAKQDAVCVCTGRNRAAASFLHHKQLSLLQRRMHKAMLKYLKQRGVHSQAGLARFQALSNQNNQKMKALQEQLSRADGRISAFLRPLTHGLSPGHHTAVAVTDAQRCLDGDGLNGAMHTVQIAE